MSGPSYTHPNFVADPVFCPLTYTYTETPLTDANGNTDTAISRTDETFTFTYNKDDAPVNPVAQTQTVTITATSGSLYTQSFPSKTASNSFDLTFTDPCLSETTSSVIVTAQSGTFTDNYSSTPLVFTYNAFGTNPSFCNASVTCASVSPSNIIVCPELDENG